MSDSTDSTNGNLGSGERVVSAILGAAFSLLALRRGDGVTRAVAGVTGAALLARSFAGHCAVKAAMTGESSLSEGVAEQWRHMRQKSDDLTRNVEIGLEMMSARVDEAVEESFPASDPPAVHLRDDPPVNADDKWAAARAAERSNGHHQN
jgi:hypothetical protein